MANRRFTMSEALAIQARNEPAKKIVVEDKIAFPVWLWIPGNHENPRGNPIPYHRTTQRAKSVEKGALRYAAWKQFVQQCWISKTGGMLPQVPNGHYSVQVYCRFAGSCELHPDPDNVLKGLLDSLFVNGDRHITSSVSFKCNVESPGVEICVSPGNF